MDRKPEDRKSGGDQSSGRNSKMTPAIAAREAVRQLQELSRHEVEGVVGIEKGDDGGWTVTVEVVESRRIPDTADVLAEYAVGIDDAGDLTTYSRKSRYVRGRTSRE
ncbi:gas vesicle protein GvpO [Diaminobutyricibacter sp. McL0618]|uniref:gas vesicle protein GvpO n=1 Tax=Leifsonia sp. McL0618 TaxID=3415677 RepID=UPI003CF8E4B6